MRELILLAAFLSSGCYAPQERDIVLDGWQHKQYVGGEWQTINRGDFCEVSRDLNERGYRIVTDIRYNSLNRICIKEPNKIYCYDFEAKEELCTTR